MKYKTIFTITIIIIIITISVIYTTCPRLQLNGSPNITMSYREKYEEAGVIVKNANGNYMSKIKIENNIDTTKIGNYYIDYSLKLKEKKLHVRRNIKIIDNISPVIKLKGNQIIEMSINTEYKEPGYTAIDEYDGDITDKVEIKGKIDTENYGEYVLTYKVKDNSDNTTEVNRIIKIIDEEKPKIECYTDYSAFQIGTENPIGCKAIDNFDGDITEKIKITGEYNKNIPGIYKIKYEVKDDAGNKTEKEHNITMFNNQANPKAYIITNNNKINETKELLNEKNIKATFIQKQINEELINELKEQGHKTELKINNTTYKNIDDFKEYCQQNKIKFIEINEKMTQNEIEQIINQLNNDEKNILIFNEENTTEKTKIFIQLLNEMNYKFDTINNYK